MTLNRTGGDEKAIQYANEAIRLLEDLDDDQSLGWAQFYLGIASVEEGYTNLNEVERLWAVSHTSFTAADYAPGVAFAKLLLTAAALIRDPSSSLPAAEALVAAGKGAGNNNLTAHALEFVANAKRVLGDLEESAAAVGSLMILFTSRPAIFPASCVAFLCASLKYAGTVITASVTLSPNFASASLFNLLKIIAEISSGL